MGYHLSPLRGSGQRVPRKTVCGERTGRSVADSFDGINAALRTWWDFAVFGELDVGRQIIGKVDGFAILFVFLQGELIGCGINLTQVVDAGIHSAGASCLDEIGKDDQHENSGTKKGEDDQSFGFPRHWQTSLSNQKPTGTNQTYGQNCQD